MSPDEVATLLEHLLTRVQDSRRALKDELDHRFEEDPAGARKILVDMIAATDRAGKLMDAAPELHAAVERARGIEALLGQMVALSQRIEPEVEALRRQLTSDEFARHWVVIREEAAETPSSFAPLALSEAVAGALGAVRGLPVAPVAPAPSTAGTPAPAAAVPVAPADPVAPASPRAAFLARLREVARPLSSGIVVSECGDPLETFDMPPPSGDFTFTALLAHSGFLRAIDRSEYRAKVADHLGIDPDAPWFEDWEKQLADIELLQRQVTLLELKIFSLPDREEWEDVIHLLAIRESTGDWWIAGPQLGQPPAIDHEGAEPLPPLPGWLQPITQQPLLMMYGQETVMVGGGTSPPRVRISGPLIAAHGATVEQATDRYLLAARVAGHRHFLGFSRPDEADPGIAARVDRLDQTLLAGLDHPELWVLGICANYYHFVVGRCDDGYAGIMFNAVWT